MDYVTAFRISDYPNVVTSHLKIAQLLGMFGIKQNQMVRPLLDLQYNK